jgi:D-alanine-D-alanine ligase
MSGNGVLAALQSKGVDAHAFDPGQRSLAELAAEKFDRVFIALHGRFGEDGSLQGALELLGIPYTGSGVMASAVGMDKITTKIVWLHRPADAALCGAERQSDLAAVCADLGLPLIVKPPHEGSTIGITKVTEAGAESGLRHRGRAGRSVLAEEFITGREFTVPCWAPAPRARAAGRGDRRAGRQLRLPEQVLHRRHEVFLPGAAAGRTDGGDAAHRRGPTVHSVAKGWGRVDVLLRERDQKPSCWMNTSPGMTGHSLVPMAARAEGISYEDLCVEILRSARLKMKG